MKLITELDLSPHKKPANYHQRVMTIGSCFSDHIGTKLCNHNIPVIVNPLGITFNPISLSKALSRSIKRDLIEINDLQSCQGLYAHFDFHGKFNNPEKNVCYQSINRSISTAHEFIDKGIDYLIITLGTAFVYKHRSTEKIVNNCHKLPSDQFDRKLLNVDQIVASLSDSINDIITINPEAEVIFTVSPVRHIRDGIVNNARSKAILVEACHQLCEAFSCVNYFPSYEIMMDVLRDYRFYHSDMIHPSDQAVDYIWDKFYQWFYDDKSQQFIKESEKINKMKAHRILHPETESAKSWQTKITKVQKDFELKYKLYHD